jgi:hypothetical protein
LFPSSKKTVIILSDFQDAQEAEVQNSMSVKCFLNPTQVRRLQVSENTALGKYQEDEAGE